jgi:hypothetical protein
MDDKRRGVVYIAPAAIYLPSGRMVDPKRSAFYVHWEDWDEDAERGELLEDAGVIESADAAIAWDRARCGRVLIRLTHTYEGLYSAGTEPLTDERDGRVKAFPEWLPMQPPPEGWWTPEDEAAADTRTRDSDE